MLREETRSSGCFSALRAFISSRRDRRAPSPDATLDVKDSQTNAKSTTESDVTFCYGSCCDFTLSDVSASTKGWKSLNNDKPPAYSESEDIYRPEVMDTIEKRIEELDADLRDLSLKIHDHPELGFHEIFAHDTLTAFMSTHGFAVTKHYAGLATAWRAEFVHNPRRAAPASLPVLGVNSEMDALPGIGHACGHNLIAVAGVAVALGVKAALEEWDIPGRVVLLGTPAEESGGGKVILLEKGAYEDMDICIMCHPGPGPANAVGSGSTLALKGFDVEFFGQNAHAGAAPWEGTNALDAAFVAYSAISALRQQMQPTHRVHGVVSGRDWAPNIIPDYAKMSYMVRAPTREEMQDLSRRVEACFTAAGMATGCKVKISESHPLYDLHQNPVLSRSFMSTCTRRLGLVEASADSKASTDFGNVTYALPAFHPLFTIPTKPNGGNHTKLFAESAATQEAHDACMATAKGLAITGLRALDDHKFLEEVKAAFAAEQPQ